MTIRLHTAAIALALVMAPALATAQPAVTAGTFHNCPEGGRTKVAKVKALNVLKNRATVPETINRDAALEALVEKGDDTDRWNQNDGGEIEGYIVDVVPGGIESVNCGTKVIQYRDTHIFVGGTADAQKRDCVIVEVTPRWRTAMAGDGTDWSTATLKKTLVGKRVQIQGWLFPDAEHKQNAVNTNPKGSTLWRATIWELHPVTAIHVLP